MEATANPSQRSESIPELRGWPIIGLLPKFQRDIMGTMREASELGDVVRLSLLNRSGYLINHPEGVKRVLVDNHRNYGKRTRGYKMLSIALGNGLVTSQGDFWRRQRRIAQPAFHHHAISGFQATMDDAATRMVERWRAPSLEGEPLQVDAEMMRVTLEIVGRCLLSTDLSDQTGPVGEAITVVLHETIWRLTHPLALPLAVPTAHNRRLRESLSRMQELVARVIEDRREGASQSDLLSMLMDARDEEGEGMSDEQLRDEVMTMVSAGHETTAVALTWCLDQLARHPEVRERLEAEVDAVLEDDGPIDLERLRELEFTEAVVKEAMRLRPPIWMVARSTEEDDIILGRAIPKGAYVFLPQFLLHQDPRYWEAPEAFRPERFLGASGKAISKHLYFPFAGGPRVCIGMAFAMMEAKTLLARAVRGGRFEHVPGHPVVPEPTITLRPKYGLPMTVRWRG